MEDNSIVIWTVVIGIIVAIIWRGYRDEMHPKILLHDNGDGTQSTLCKTCKTQLIPVSKSTGGGCAFIAVILGIIGFLLIFANPIFGALLLIIALLLGIMGKSNRVELTCPSCGQIAKTLD